MNVVFRVLVAAALAVDAIVHVTLAANYQLAAPGGIGAGNIFRIQAAIAVLAAIYVLARGSRRAFIVAGLVTVTAFAAVIIYRYIDVPAFGPIPAMYEPIWFAEKTLSAVAEGAGAVLAGLALTTTTQPRRPASPTTVEVSASLGSAPTLKSEGPPVVNSSGGFAHWTG